MEIERKFLPDMEHLPFQPEDYPCRQIEQGYLCTEPVVRIRRDNDKYFLTYKSKGLMVREEYNLPLTFYKFNPRELSSVMYALEGQGMRVDAAETAMSIIENILGRRDNKQYYDAVNVLRHFEEMARDDPQVKKMYDGYFQKLKVERARFTKFWGIYNGTYQEKSRSHSYW